MEVENARKTAEFGHLGGQQSDVVHPHQLTMATEVPRTVDSQSDAVFLDIAASGAAVPADVAARNLNNVRCSDGDCSGKVQDGGQLLGAKSGRTKRRRRKSKGKTNSKPYRKSNWRFQQPRSRNWKQLGLGQKQSLVPYNTNKFLMEDHMSEYSRSLLIPMPRTRDSSLSVDSEDNYFYSLPEGDEEFLIKEFSNVYESARSERLEGMTKSQLIQEYLLLQSNFDKLNRDVGKLSRSRKLEDIGGSSPNPQDRIQKLEQQIKDLSSENYDLRQQLSDLRKRHHRQRSRCNSNSNSHSDESASSEDSESDSTMSGTSDESHSSRSSDQILSDSVIVNGVAEADCVMNGDMEPLCNGHDDVDSRGQDENDGIGTPFNSVSEPLLTSKNLNN